MKMISEEAVVLSCIAFLGGATEEDVSIISDSMRKALEAFKYFESTHMVVDPDVGDEIYIVATYDNAVTFVTAVWDGNFWITSKGSSIRTENLKVIIRDNVVYSSITPGNPIFKKEILNGYGSDS